MARSIPEIIEQLREALRENQSDLATFPDFGNLYSIYRSFGIVVQEQELTLDTITNNLYLSTATGEALNKKAQEFNITRNVGTASSGPLLVYSSNNFTIPEGVILTDPISKLQFKINSPIKVINGRGRGNISCTTFTPLGNLESGTELQSSIYTSTRFVVGNSLNPITNNFQGSLVGGSFREDDESLRTRVINVVYGNNTSTIQALTNRALSINNVSRVTVIENQPSLGYITVYINSSDKITKDLVLANLANIKPVGTAVLVKTYNTALIDVNASINLTNNQNQETKLQEIRGKLENYFNNVEVGSIITKESLGGVLLSLSYVSNVKLFQPSGDVELSASQIPALGELNVSFN